MAETVLETKGVLAGLQISRTGTKISNIKTKDLNNADQSNVFYCPKNDLAFVGDYDSLPYNVYNLNYIKEQLTKDSTNMNFKVDGKGNGVKDNYFIETLKGEHVHLKGVKVEEISYTKRLPEETVKLRKEFNSSLGKNLQRNLLVTL